MEQIVLGDKVTLMHKKGVWGTVENLTNSTTPQFTKFDVRYPDGQIETGMTLANVDNHEPLK
ncbi:hypothetical protein [Enterobacter ludwigii]|nr:hypothetical protein [Enterobacter kobei]